MSSDVGIERHYLTDLLRQLCGLLRVTKDGGIRFALARAIVLVLAALSRIVHKMGFLLKVLAVSRRHGHRQEPAPHCSQLRCRIRVAGRVRTA